MSLLRRGQGQRFLAHARQLKAENAAIIWPTFKAVCLPQNIVLYHRLNAALGEVMTPILAGMIAEGVEQGVFNTPDPETTAQMILRLGAVTHDAIARIVAAEGTADLEAALAAFEHRMQMQGLAIDRCSACPTARYASSNPASPRP